MPVLRLLPALALCALLRQDPAQDKERSREYEISDIVRVAADAPAPLLGGLLGLHEDGSADDEPASLGDFQAITTDDLVVLITRCCSPDIWGDENTLEILPNGRLLVSAPDDAHKEVRQLLDYVRSRLAPEIVVDATLVELTAGSLLDLLGGGATPALLPDDRTRKLQQLVKDGADAKNPRRLRVSARPGLRSHERSLALAKYLADVDYETVEEKAMPRVSTATVRTGVTLEVRPALVEGGITLDYTWCDTISLGDPDTLAVGDAKLQMPRVRRRRIDGQLFLPNTATAFAGAFSIPGRPGWRQALFLRPQIDPKLARAAEPAIAILPVGGLSTVPLGVPADQTGRARLSEDDLSTLLQMQVERETWDEDAGRAVFAAPNLLVIRNDADVVKKCRAWLAARAARDLATVGFDVRLVRLPAAQVADELTPRAIDKLLAVPPLWAGLAVATNDIPATIEDLVRRPVIHDYAIVGGRPDPAIQILEWGVRFRARGALDPDTKNVLVRGLKLEWSEASEPIATLAHPAAKDAVIHAPKRTAHVFSGEPTLAPGEWTALGVGSLGDESVVLLVRAMTQK
jgi:hypothetical protein